MGKGKRRRQQPKHTKNCSKTGDILRVIRRINKGMWHSHWGILLKCSECGRLGKNPVKISKAEKETIRNEKYRNA